MPRRIRNPTTKFACRPAGFLSRQRATGAGNVTALHVAAAHNATDVIEALLCGGADVSARTTDGSTALLRAAATGAVGAMMALVAAGASATHQVRALIQRSVRPSTSSMKRQRAPHTCAIPPLTRAMGDIMGPVERRRTSEAI